MAQEKSIGENQQSNARLTICDYSFYFAIMVQFISRLNTLNPVLLVPVILIGLVGILLLSRRRFSQEANVIKQELQWLQLNLILLSVFIVTAGTTVFFLNRNLDTFGYPATVDDIQTPAQVLEYLQQYNRAIATNTYALIWFLYAFVLWFLTSLYAFAQVIATGLWRRSIK